LVTGSSVPGTVIAAKGGSMAVWSNRPGAYVFNRLSRESSLAASDDSHWFIDHTGSLDTSQASLNLLAFPKSPLIRFPDARTVQGCTLV
jgi:hypothetical protein